MPFEKPNMMGFLWRSLADLPRKNCSPLHGAVAVDLYEKFCDRPFRMLFERTSWNLASWTIGQLGGGPQMSRSSTFKEQF